MKSWLLGAAVGLTLVLSMACPLGVKANPGSWDFTVSVVNGDVQVYIYWNGFSNDPVDYEDTWKYSPYDAASDFVSGASGSCTMYLAHATAGEPVVVELYFASGYGQTKSHNVPYD